MKRSFDLVFSAISLLVLWPVLLGIALLVGLSDGRPVFFRQERVGQGGQRFKIWKFRSMVRDAEERGTWLTVGHDSRITPIGYWLRKTKLDELPQLLNVLVGDMSIVGPRPEVPYFVEQYDDLQQDVLKLMPGITDPASIQFYSESDSLAGTDSPEEYYLRHIMPKKIRINLEYAEDATLRSDIGVIFKTIRRMAV